MDRKKDTCCYKRHTSDGKTHTDWKQRGRKRHFMQMEILKSWGSNTYNRHTHEKTLKQELKKDPAILLLGIYPKKPKTLMWKDICIPKFAATLLTMDKVYKRPKHPWLKEWIKRKYTYTMEYYSAPPPNLTICNNMDLGGIIYCLSFSVSNAPERD